MSEIGKEKSQIFDLKYGNYKGFKKLAIRTNKTLCVLLPLGTHKYYERFRASNSHKYTAPV